MTSLNLYLCEQALYSISKINLALSVYPLISKITMQVSKIDKKQAKLTCFL